MTLLTPGLPPGKMDRAVRAGLLILGAVALLAGLTGALVLLGLEMPSQATGLAGAHGPLMTLGFLGTLIALERAVALGQSWGYFAPLEAGIGGLLLVLGWSVSVAAIALATGGLMLVLVYVAIGRVDRSLHGLVETSGAVCWVVGAVLLWTGRPVADVVPWLAGFLVLTISGERLELSRVMRHGPVVRHAFLAVIAVFIAGVATSVVAPDLGLRIAGAGLVGLAAWLGRNDLARRTVRATGVTRYIAVCLLLGYAWIALAGAVSMAEGSVAGGPGYDIQLHALFLGFVVSMVFGHAPVILPAVLRVPLPYGRGLYLPVVLLHGSLVLRIVGGDVLGSGAWFQLGGVLNVTALLLFLGIAAGSILWARRRHPAARGTMPA